MCCVLGTTEYDLQGSLSRQGEGFCEVRFLDQRENPFGGEMKDGGPAFARSIGHGTLMVAGDPSNLEVAPQEGMSLRDYFAAAALAGLLPQHAHGQWPQPEPLADWCYQIADAMLIQRRNS